MTLVLSASLVYLLSTVVYGTYLLRFEQRYVRVALGLLALGLLVNVAAIGTRLAGEEFNFGTFDFLLLSSALVVGIYLGTFVLRPVYLLGAFIAPIVTMVTYSLHVFHREAEVARSAVVEIVTPVHIVTSMIGFLIFAVAAVACVLIIVQEHRLKTKRFPVASARLPSLADLERFSHWALIIGFPIYTIGTVLGAVWFMRDSDASITRHFVMAAFSWLLYAVTLHARIVVGWKGRRAAILTLVAFASALFVVSLSILRTSS